MAARRVQTPWLVAQIPLPLILSTASAVLLTVNVAAPSGGDAAKLAANQPATTLQHSGARCLRDTPSLAHLAVSRMDRPNRDDDSGCPPLGPRPTLHTSLPFGANGGLMAWGGNCLSMQPRTGDGSAVLTGNGIGAAAAADTYQEGQRPPLSRPPRPTVHVSRFSSPLEA